MVSAKHRLRKRSGRSLSEEALEALDAFAGLLRERAVPLGLVGRSDADRILERHVLDCLRAADLFERDDRTAFDLGSGAGLPGLVLALVLPTVRFRLIEPRARAVGFLELAIERLGLANADVIHGRAEDVDDLAEVVTARAFGPLRRTWPVAARLLGPGGRLVYFAGAGPGEDAEREARRVAARGPRAVVDVRVFEAGGPLVIMGRA